MSNDKQIYAALICWFAMIALFIGGAIFVCYMDEKEIERKDKSAHTIDSLNTQLRLIKEVNTHQNSVIIKLQGHEN